MKQMWRFCQPKWERFERQGWGRGVYKYSLILICSTETECKTLRPNWTSTAQGPARPMGSCKRASNAAHSSRYWDWMGHHAGHRPPESRKVANGCLPRIHVFLTADALLKEGLSRCRGLIIINTMLWRYGVCLSKSKMTSFNLTLTCTLRWFLLLFKKGALCHFSLKLMKTLVHRPVDCAFYHSDHLLLAFSAQECFLIWVSSQWWNTDRTTNDKRRRNCEWANTTAIGPLFSLPCTLSHVSRKAGTDQWTHVSGHPSVFLMITHAVSLAL